MSDFQKIGDSLICIRVDEPVGHGSCLADHYYEKSECGNWWIEITNQRFYQRKAELDKVPS